MATVLITGGAGFIGSNLARGLLAQGDSVHILDDLSSGRMVNIEPILDQVTFFEGDIRNAAQVEEAMTGCDYVLHQAALPSVARSVDDPILSNDVNVNGCLVVLNTARNLGVKRVVFAASSSAYGETPVLPKVETMAPKPQSPYGVAKLACEYYLQAFHHVYGLETVALRYFNVFGPRQAPDSAYAAVIPLFVSKMLSGERPTVNGDGLHSRDFCYIDNVVEANLKALTAPDAAGKVYNVAVGGRYTLLDLIASINDTLGTSIAPIHGPERAGDIRDSQADITAAVRDLGYTASIDFAEGLRRSIEWYRDPANV
ncbi:MAG: SDR family oxidoreductase [Myxococcales bacterium]|nr:SDR family oxidoreductase [Myxococcales bacterium]